MFETFASGSLLTAEALNGLTDNFMSIMSANLPLLLGVAGTMFGLNWVLRKVNKVKNGRL